MTLSIMIAILVLISFLFVFFIFSIFALKKKKENKVFNIFKIARNSKNEAKIKEFTFGNLLTNALTTLAQEKIGALIVVSRNDDLTDFEKNGYKITGEFSPEFAMSVFSNKKSALHDGAMIIQNYQIRTVSAYLPMTKNIIDVKYGARHRAAIGMSEVTDAIIFVVSETTGLISYAKNGVITTLSKDFNETKKNIFNILNIKNLEIEE